MNISGDLRVSSSSSESLMGSPNNLLKEILSETGMSRSLLDSALVGVTITGRARRASAAASSRGLISADGAGWGLSLEGGLLKSWASQPQWKAALMFGVAPSAPWPFSWLSLREGALCILPSCP